MRNGRLTMLLIESSGTSRQVLLNQIGHLFPQVEIHAANTAAEALQLLQKNEHDIIICDALLARDQRIDLASHICTEGDPIVIVITGDRDIEMDSFPGPIKKKCVQHVAYKPVDLTDLLRMVQDAVEKVEMRKAGVRDR